MTSQEKTDEIQKLMQYQHDIAFDMVEITQRLLHDSQRFNRKTTILDSIKKELDRIADTVTTD